MPDTPQVWIGCLAAYNDGKLLGEWIDATDVDTLNEGRAAVLAASPVPGAEETFIADYDGFGSLASSLGEHTSTVRCLAVSRLLDLERGDGRF